MALAISLTGKVVLITGVSSGIGLATAAAFAAAGAHVAGCAKEETSDIFISAVSQHHVSALYVQADVTDPAALENFVHKAVQHFGQIDILVSNAGQNMFRGASGCTPREWQDNLSLNLSSHWQIARMCKPFLAKNKGVILIMTSNHAYSTMPGCFPYNVAKAGLTAMVQSLAMEWGPEIRTVGIAPGFIDTPGNQAWFDTFPDPEQQRQLTIDLHPVKNLGHVSDVGAWCVFLSSSYAAFASGVTYVLDGGRSAVMQDR